MNYNNKKTIKALVPQEKKQGIIKNDNIKLSLHLNRIKINKIFVGIKIKKDRGLKPLSIIKGV